METILRIRQLYATIVFLLCISTVLGVVCEDENFFNHMCFYCDLNDTVYQNESQQTCKQHYDKSVTLRLARNTDQTMLQTISNMCYRSNNGSVIFWTGHRKMKNGSLDVSLDLFDESLYQVELQCVGLDARRSKLFLAPCSSRLQVVCIVDMRRHLEVIQEPRECSWNCRERNCDNFSGECLSGCVGHYTGQYCEENTVSDFSLVVIMTGLVMLLIPLTMLFRRQENNMPLSFEI